MALAPLATTADLTDRNIGVDTTADTMLAVASAAVRGAAGSPISETTSTVTLTTLVDSRRGGEWLRLPGAPVRSVTSVSIDGEAVTNYSLVGDRLWRCVGWGNTYGPHSITVTYAHGLTVVPAHVVDLVCSLAAAGMAAAAEGYEAHAGVVAERIDDYSVTYAQGAAAVASVMELPSGTRSWLRSMFGGTAGTVAAR